MYWDIIDIYKLKVYNMLIWYIYVLQMITPIVLADTSIPSQN